MGIDTLRSYINNSSSTSIDLLYCIIDFIKEINTYYINLESNKFSCSFISNNPYFFFFNKLNPKSFKRNKKSKNRENLIGKIEIEYCM